MRAFDQARATDNHPSLTLIFQHSLSRRPVYCASASMEKCCSKQRENWRRAGNRDNAITIGNWIWIFTFSCSVWVVGLPCWGNEQFLDCNQTGRIMSIGGAHQPKQTNHRIKRQTIESSRSQMQNKSFLMFCCGDHFGRRLVQTIPKCFARQRRHLNIILPSASSAPFFVSPFNWTASRNWYLF